MNRLSRYFTDELAFRPLFFIGLCVGLGWFTASLFIEVNRWILLEIANKLGLH